MATMNGNGIVGEGDNMPMTVRIRGLLSEMQPAMRKVGEYAVKHPSQVSTMTISALAERTNVSETTVVRFCREIGVEGYAQLRLALATELGSRNQTDARFEGEWDITSTDTLASAVEKIAYADSRSVADTARAVPVDVLEKIARKILASRRIDVMGVGASGIVAQDLQQKLHRIGLVSAVATDSHQALVSAALLDSDCVAIAISHSGSTIEVVDALVVAREEGATTVAITNSPRSAVAEAADFVLPTAVLEATFRAAATGSRLAQLTVVDCLFVAVAQQSFARSINALEKTRGVIEEFKRPQS